MNDLQNQIISYLYDISGGCINLSYSQANALINLVRSGEKHGQAHLYRYEARGWTLVQTIAVPDEIIEQKTASNNSKEDEMKRFFYFDCYSSTGLFKGKIYTIDTEIFNSKNQ